MKKRFLSCVIALLLVIACISGLSARAYAVKNNTENETGDQVDVIAAINHYISYIEGLDWMLCIMMDLFIQRKI